MQRIHRSRRRGFTLVELLIVVMIVGILSLAAISIIGRDNIPRAQETEALGAMGVLRGQLEMWYLQNGGAMPTDLAAWESIGGPYKRQFTGQYFNDYQFEAGSGFDQQTGRFIGIIRAKGHNGAKDLRIEFKADGTHTKIVGG